MPAESRRYGSRTAGFQPASIRPDSTPRILPKMQAAAFPDPFAELRRTFAAFVAGVGGIGVLYVTGVIDYFLERRLRGKIDEIVAGLRAALMRRALELLPKLKPRRVMERSGRRFRPRVRSFDLDRPKPPSAANAPSCVTGPEPEPVPYPGFGPRIRSLDGPQRPTIPPERIPFCGRVALQEITREPRGEGKGPRRPTQGYYFAPENVSSKPLARMLEAIARILDDPEKYARRLARRLRADAADTDKPPPLLLRDAALFEKRFAQMRTLSLCADNDARGPEPRGPPPAPDRRD